MCSRFRQYESSNRSFLHDVWTVFHCTAVQWYMFSYYKVLSTTHQHQVNTAPSLRYRTNCGGSSSLKEIHVTRVLLYVATGFLCCWIPMWAFIRWKRFSPETCPRKAANLVTFFLFLSATINPFIYAFTNCGF